MKTVTESTKAIPVIIYETKDYSLFNYISGNREKRFGGEIRRLQKQSLKKHGWFRHEPAKVILHNGKYLILDGQHRAQIAEELGIEIVYTVLDMPYGDALQIIPTMQISKPWSFIDYIHKYASEGIRDYVCIEEFSKIHNIPVGSASSLLYGELPSSMNISSKIKGGEYKVKNILYANKVLEVYNMIMPHINRTHSRLLLACAKVVHVKEFDAIRLKKKLEKYGHLIKNVHSCNNFLDLIEEIYNRGSSNKVNLAFLTNEAIKRRDVINRPK